MSHKPTVDEHLAAVPLFSRLTPKELELVRSMLTEVDVPAGQVLAKEGSAAHEFFIIVSGSASVDRHGEHLADVGPGNYQGELSLLDGGPRTATVTATSPMTILVASQREFASLLDSTPMIARRMLPELAHRVRALTGDAHTH